MKPAAFDYHAPRTVEEALSLLHEHQDEAKVLAGGQSLVPAMNFRLARPAVLVDIAQLPGLDRIDVSDPASVTVGARGCATSTWNTTRSRDLWACCSPGLDAGWATTRSV